MWDEYLTRLKNKTPQLADPDAKMTLSVESFLKQLQRAYEEGRKDTDMFDQLFGRTK